ncbi:MAG: 5-(carboxyamino)imidazole ribonucleotide synthase [Chloroflexota bacterium]|nr:5-(carboxyamino)imidazole ribonucleotide synthase [Chloroflexota bacterium]
MATPILPGAVIGVLGSGQLGRMLALAARAMGYRIHVFSPDRYSPAGQVADHEIAAPYDDAGALTQFMRGIDVLTFEFENVDAAAARIAEELDVPVRPGGWVLQTAQQRVVEKTFLRDAGLPVANFAAIETPADLAAAISTAGFPAVLKTAAFGYDGKGQAVVHDAAGLENAWSALGGQPAILEAYVEFAAEISVVGARNPAGQFAHYGAIENIHRDHILDISIAPARIIPAAAAQAVDLTHAVMEELDAVGVLCVEFFLAKDGRLFINEIAPRPHNSGHLTIEAAFASQFEQQVRAICALPLADTHQARPAAMANLLGDLWSHGEPDWAAALAVSNVKLHLYGKREARPGRKMGHLTALGPDAGSALATVTAARCALSGEASQS